MIGICIKYFHSNYGGMLQAYATVKAFEAYGVPYELVRYQKKMTIVGAVRSLPRLLNRTLRNDKREALKKRIGKLRHPAFAADDARRERMFARFCEEHFTHLSHVFIGYAALRDGARRYTAVVTGSDQLWSPAGLPTNYYNLRFVPDEILKISLASSFGVSDIPWYQKNRTKQYLDRIPYISMREDRGSEIVRALTGRDVPTIPDPVFLHSREAWLELIPDAPCDREPYVFAYFLGRSRAHREAVERLAEAKGLRIVTLRHMDQYVEADETFGDEAPYDVGPAEFLHLLRHATCVCTDSFHGTAFSILFEKQFIVFNRYRDASRTSKNSRIDTLCRHFGLETRRWDPTRDIRGMVSDMISYEEVREKVAAQRQSAERYMEMIVGEIRRREETRSGAEVIQNGETHD